MAFERKTSVSLPEKLKELLLAGIADGSYPPGSKMPSVRTLCREFGFSSLTVQRALRLLAADGVVTPKAASGVYINTLPETSRRRGKLVLVFPEMEISPDSLDPEGLAISSEIYRGLLAGGQINNIQTDFIHVDYRQPEAVQLEAMTRLQKYDTAVFAGEQLGALQLKLAEIMPVFRICTYDSSTGGGIIRVTYDIAVLLRKLLKHLTEQCGVRRAGIISLLPQESNDTTFIDRRETFLRLCREEGIEIPEEFVINIYGKSPVACDEYLRRKGVPEFIFCNQTYLVRDFYESCLRCNLAVGRDVKTAAVATGHTFQGLIPDITYVKTPMFELAFGLVGDTRYYLDHGVMAPAPAYAAVNAQLIIGKSTTGGF